MRRLLLVLTVAALMAAMVVTAGPAKADVSLGVGGSSFGGSSFDSGAVDFDSGDDDEDGFNNRVFFVQSNSELDDFEPEGIAFG
jgi:hypothetical protein